MSSANYNLIDALLYVANSVHSCGKNHHKKKSLNFKFGLPKLKGAHRMSVAIAITNEQKIPVSLAPVTETGKPAKVDGKPTWTVSSGDSTVVVADDGLSAFLVSSDTPGDSQIVIAADADLGDGVETISDVITLTVVGAKAVNLGISVGAPVPKA